MAGGMGLAALFGSAFLAATILPLSSEAVLAALLVSGDFSLWSLWLVATVGNVAGSWINWGLGRWALHFQDRKWFPVTEEDLDRAQERFNRYGLPSLLFAWVPVIGDPLTLVAGVMRTPLVFFLPLVAIGKGGRYAVFIWLAEKAS